MAHTITNPSPYQVSMAMRVTREVARDMLTDDSGSTYTRDVFGELVTLDPVARTLTTHTPAPASERSCAWPSGIHAYASGKCTRCGAPAPARKGVVYAPAMAGEGEVANPGAEYALTMFGFRTVYAPDSVTLANLAGIDRVSRLAPVPAIDALGAHAPAHAGSMSNLIAEWLTDPVYTGVTRTPEGYVRIAMGEELTRYARTAN